MPKALIGYAEISARGRKENLLVISWKIATCSVKMLFFSMVSCISHLPDGFGGNGNGNRLSSSKEMNQAHTPRNEHEADPSISQMNFEAVEDDDEKKKRGC